MCELLVVIRDTMLLKKLRLCRRNIYMSLHVDR